MNADSTDIHKYLGQVIVERRQKVGWSQRELSLYAGIHRTYVSDIERGTRNITVSVLERVANALQVSMAVLFRDAEAARRRDSKGHGQVS